MRIVLDGPVDQMRDALELALRERHTLDYDWLKDGHGWHHQGGRLPSGMTAFFRKNKRGCSVHFDMPPIPKAVAMVLNGEQITEAK